MITGISNGFINQVCGNCGKTNLILIAGLEAGVSGDKNIVKLPECSCGAIECLNRTFKNTDDHAGIVNGLHEHLVKNDKINLKWSSALKNEKEKPVTAFIING